MSTPSTPSKNPPTRRLALLEARLEARPSKALPKTPPPEEDDVQSFSSDASHPSYPPNSRRRYAPRIRRETPPTSAIKKRKRFQTPRTTRVDSFFKPASGKDNSPPAANSPSCPPAPTGGSPGPPGMDRSPSLSPSGADAYRYFRDRVDQLVADNAALKEKDAAHEQMRAENEDLRTQLELEVPELRGQLAAKTNEARMHERRADALAESLKKVVIQMAKVERRDARNTIVADSERLGKVVVERTRTSLHEVWEDGYEWKQVAERLNELRNERDFVERKRKDILKKKALEKKNQAASPERTDDNHPSESAKRGEMPPPSQTPLRIPFEETPEYALEQEDVYRVQLLLLRKEENSLQEKRIRLARDRDIMVREIRRQSDERMSAFNNFPMLNQRYLLLNLLGRGGFSEVFKAFDLQRAVYVACKIHQLASNWSEEKKRSFIRHAWREYKIHKSLKHPRVVQLVDIFEIDENTFCTVLEYCEGSDLDSYLRLYKSLPEKEARSIISQVFSGLQYLAEQKRRIIHYDLKPGNILLHKGEVQITDFGLSKVMNETESTTEGMELTSQGAGTMWYLPPECFETASPARISVKVDVWSAGVILFQMLYGRKPFGHDQSQEKMFREKTVAHQELQFPPRPAVSDAAKDFMRKCLTRSAVDRPDVKLAMLHPFLKRR